MSLFEDMSVVIPTFHREKEVVEAVESALTQEGVSLEVIVLDDSPTGSARQAIEGLAGPRIRYVRRDVPSGGKPALVRNEGARLARGRYLYFLDDDDHVLPGALLALVSALDTNPKAGVAFGTVVPFGDDQHDLRINEAWARRAAQHARRSAQSRWLAVASILFQDTMVINSACLLRREHFDALGGYDHALTLAEDVEFYLRAIRKFGHVFVDHPVLHRRTGAAALVHNLQGDNTPVAESYRLMHRKYKHEHGPLEFLLMKILGGLLLPALFHNDFE